MAEWKTGDVITADKLNAITPEVITYILTSTERFGEYEGTCDHELSDIITLLENNSLVIVNVYTGSISQDNYIGSFTLDEYINADDEVSVIWEQLRVRILNSNLYVGRYHITDGYYDGNEERVIEGFQDEMTINGESQ